MEIQKQKPLLTHSPSFSDDAISTDDRIPVSSPDYSFSFSINSPPPTNDLADSIFSNGWILPTCPNPKSCPVPEPIDLDLRSRSISSSEEIELDSPRTLKKKWKIRDFIFGRRRRSLSDAKPKFRNSSLGKGENMKEMDMSSVHGLFYGKEKAERRTFLPYRQDLLGGLLGSTSRRTKSFDL